jgi:hypothetical protein
MTQLAGQDLVFCAATGRDEDIQLVHCSPICAEVDAATIQIGATLGVYPEETR